MVSIEARQGIKPEHIKRFEPIMVLLVAKKGENNSEKLKLSVPEKIAINIWSNALLTGDEGFRGKFIIESRQLSEEPVNTFIVQIEPYSKADEIAIKKFNERMQDAMKRYGKYKHPVSRVPDTTDYSINHIDIFKRFYLEGFDGTPPERK